MLLLLTWRHALMKSQRHVAVWSKMHITLRMVTVEKHSPKQKSRMVSYEAANIYLTMKCFMLLPLLAADFYVFVGVACDGPTKSSEEF